MTKTFSQGILGMCGSLAAVAMTYAEQLDLWLRIAGAAVGLAVGVVTFLVMLQKYQRNKRGDHEPRN